MSSFIRDALMVATAALSVHCVEFTGARGVTRFVPEFSVHHIGSTAQTGQLAISVLGKKSVSIWYVLIGKPDRESFRGSFREAQQKKNGIVRR